METEGEQMIREIQRLLNKAKNIDMKKEGEEKMKKYKTVLESFDEIMKIFYLPDNEKRIEDSQNISLNEGAKNMLDTTVETLQLLDLKNKDVTREELEKNCKKLLELH